MGKALEITSSNFDEVLKSDKPVLVDFWAEWCAPCKAIGSIVEELAGDYEGKAVVGKLDVDAYSDIATKFGIRGIPTLLVFKNGVLIDKQIGAASKTTLANKLDAAINA